MYYGKNYSKKWLHKFLTAVLCFIVPAFAKSQNLTVDNLLRSADKQSSISADKAISITKQAYLLALKNKDKIGEARSLNYITNFYCLAGNYTQADYFAQKGLQAAKISAADTLIGDSWASYGIIAHSMDKFEIAISRYKNAVVYYKRVNAIKSLGVVYLNLGACARKLGQFDIANSYYFAAANVFQKTHDETNLYKSYNLIGNCFSALKRFDDAIKYHRLALNYRLKINDFKLISQSYNNLGYAYLNSNNPDTSIYYLSKALHIRETLKDSSGLVLVLQNLGAAWKQKGNLYKAELCLKKSLGIAQSHKMSEEQARGWIDLAGLHLVNKKYHDAIAIADSAEHVIRGLHLPDQLIAVFDLKETAFNYIADYRKALFYNIEKNKLEDSLFTIEKNKTISELVIKYETHEKERNIKNLNTQNSLQQKNLTQHRAYIIILVLISLLLFILFVVAYHNYKLKNKANKRIKTLMDEIHHRVKNNLQLMLSLFSMQIDMQKDEETRSTLRENELRLTSMSLVHNKLYQGTGSTTMAMEEYINKLSQNIHFSFGGGYPYPVTLKTDVADIELEADKVITIGLIVNELVTNAYKYAFTHYTGEVTITLVLKQHKMILTVSDNGKGKPDQAPASGASFGLKLVDLLITQLNGQRTVNYKNGTTHQILFNV